MEFKANVLTVEIYSELRSYVGWKNLNVKQIESVLSKIRE